jgi:hypothetical protein
MRASHWFGVALFLLLLILISSIALADGGVVVSTEPQSPLPATGEAAGPIALKMAPDETTATFALYLRNTTAATLENMALFAYLENARGQTLPEVGLEFLDPADDQPLDSFSLPAGGQSQVLLQVDNLTAFGTFTGTITLQHTRTVTPSAEAEEATTETTLQVLASFSLEKPGQPKIVVQGADENGNISHTASTPDAELHLELLEDNGQVPVDDLIISLSAAAGRSDGAPGPDATLTWSSDGQSEGPLDLPAHGRRTLTLRATLPEATDYRGWLDLQYGDQLDHYTVLITRAASPAVEIQEADADGTVPLVVRSASFESTVTLKLPYGQAAVQDLVVTVGDPKREDGSPTNSAAKLGCSVCDGQAHSLEAATPLQIAITGQGLETGTYKADMILSYRHERQEVPLRITRSALASNLDLGQPETGDGINWPWPWCLHRGATVEVKAIVTEKAGQATEINYPTIELLSRLDQKGKRYSVSGETIELLRQEDSGELVIVSTTERNEMLDLAPREQATFVYRIDNLARAGTYSGKIRVLGPDSTAVEQEFTITVKDGWLFAFLTILIGVVLSYLLRQWRRTGRIRNLRAAKIARLEVEIQALHDETPEDPVWTNLQGQLRILQTRNRVEEDMSDEDVDDALNHIGERQNKYQQALAARDKIRRLLQKYPTEPEDLASKKREYEEDTQALFKTLQDQLAQPGDAGLGSAEAHQTLTNLQGKRDEIEVHAVQDPAEKLQLQVGDLIAEIEADGLDDLKKGAEALEGSVDQIVVDVQAQDADIQVQADRLSARIEEYANLRLDQLAELLRRLEAQQEAEAHVQDWGAVDARQADAWKHHGLAQDQATAAGKLEEWKKGRHDYLGASIEFLSILASPGGRPPDIDAPEWRRLLAGVPDLQRSLQAAAAAWDRESPEAERAYQRAREEYLKLLVEVMRLRIAATGDLARKRPRFVVVADWTRILAGDKLAPKLAALDAVTEALPSASDTPQERREKYEAARRSYVVDQVQALQAGHAEMNAYYEAHKTEGNHPQDPLWTDEIPAELAKMAAASAAAKDKIDPRPTTEEALLEAEKTARQAQYQYALSLQEIEGFGPPGLAPKALAPIHLVEGLAWAVAAVPVALAAALSAPSRTDLAEKKVPQYKPKPPGHYLGRVLWLDTLAALVALVVASIAGLSALWVGETAFGGVLYISAFLWGFGLTSATTAVADVWTKLGVPTS